MKSNFVFSLKSPQILLENITGFIVGFDNMDSSSQGAGEGDSVQLKSKVKYILVNCLLKLKGGYVWVNNNFSLVFYFHADIESANLGPKRFSFTFFVEFCLFSLLRFQH